MPEQSMAQREAGDTGSEDREASDGTAEGDGIPSGTSDGSCGLLRRARAILWRLINNEENY